MASAGKMTALKAATKQLLTQLQAAASQPSDVYVSLVPFSKDVNVGTSNKNQNWIDWAAWNAANGHYCKSNGNCSSTQQGNAIWTPHSHDVWNGCVTDRDQDYDVKNTSPNTTNAGTLFPAEQYDYCPVPLMGLTNDWSALSDKVDAMVPNGSTNQTIGLAWAWQTLTSGNPMNASTLPPDTNQVIILLSDGLNTQDRWYGNGFTVSTQVDTRMSKVCDNAKAAGIQIYTVHVNTDGDPTSTVLQNCATQSNMFFALTSATQMVATFQQIGTNISKLRIAK